jgi:tetratricopeptide (TPR) repeat protein
VSDISQLSALGFRLAASPDWQSVIRYFELGEGFAFIVLLVTSESGALECRYALNDFLLESGKKVRSVPIERESDLEGLTDALLAMPISAETGAVWVGRVVPESSPDYGSWAAAWRGAVARLNQFRNPLREHFQIPVILVGAPWLQRVLRENAPDLWSIKTLVARIEAEAENPPRLDADFHTKEKISPGPDPELALAEADRLKKQGKLLSASRLYHRAALGFKARKQSDLAVEQLQLSLELGDRAGASTDEQAEKKLELGRLLIWLSDYESAKTILEQSLAQFRETANISGEIKVLDRIGDIALKGMRYDAAKSIYIEVLRLGVEAGNLQGQAIGCLGLGDVARLQAHYLEAGKHLERALSLFRQTGDREKEAQCLLELGRLASSMKDGELATNWLKESSTIFRSTGNVSGEATAIKSLADVLFSLRDYEVAKTRYQQAGRLYQSDQNIEGEASCLIALGLLERVHYRNAASRSLLEEALALYCKLSHSRGQSMALQYLGDLDERDGDMGAARTRYEEALAISSRADDSYALSRAQERLDALGSGTG